MLVKWFSESEVKQLNRLVAKAKKEGWDRFIRTRSDYQALLAGCWFDESRPKKVAAFFENELVLPDRYAPDGQSLLPFKPLDWQREDILWPLFGWVKPDGTRRFRRVFIFLPKKNGKSPLASALALYLLLADGTLDPQVFLAAAARDQTENVFKPAASMVTLSPALNRLLRVYHSSKRIVFQHNTPFDGYIRALSSDATKADGRNATGIIIDELHQHANRNLFDMLEHAGIARSKPILISITTAGMSKNSVCYEEYSLAKKVASGELVDTEYLPVIYEASASDDLDDPAVWKKANPSLGTVLSEEEFKNSLARARNSAASFARFKQLRLNVWQDRAVNGFISRERWDDCAGEFPPNYRDLPCYLGLDLGSTDDFSALAYLWKDEDRYYFKARLWTPEAKVSERALQGQVPYHVWAQQKLIEVTPGAANDPRDIDLAVREAFRDLNVVNLAYDQKLSSTLSPGWLDDGLSIVVTPQNIMALTPATKELERLVLTRKLVHDGNPCVSWQAGNAVCVRDASGNLRLTKSKSPDKIDAIAALVNALSRAMLSEEVHSSPYSRPQEERVLFL